MITINTSDRLRHEITDNDDYYKTIQLLDERDNLYKLLIQCDFIDIDYIETINSDIADIEDEILIIRKKYNKIIERLED